MIIAFTLESKHRMNSSVTLGVKERLHGVVQMGLMSSALSYIWALEIRTLLLCQKRCFFPWFCWRERNGVLSIFYGVGWWPEE